MGVEQVCLHLHRYHPLHLLQLLHPGNWGGHLLSTQHCATEIQFIDGVLLLASSSGCLQNLPHISVCERMDLILNEFGFEHKFGKLEFLLANMKYKTSTVGKV